VISAPTPFGDGIVDVEDLIVLAEHLFEEIPPAVPGTPNGEPVEQFEYQRHRTTLTTKQTIQYCQRAGSYRDCQPSFFQIIHIIHLRKKSKKKRFAELIACFLLFFKKNVVIEMEIWYYWT